MGIDISQLSKVLQQAADRALQEVIGQAALEKIGKDLVGQIVLRTKLGYGITQNGGEQVKLKPLSDSYKKQRQNKVLGNGATPAKSNLTLTGKMLSDIDVKIEGTTIVLMFKDPDSGQKAQWNKENGREFMYLSRVQIERLANSIEKSLGDSMNKNIKK